MSWARLDDQYPDHPKIVEVGPLGMALHTAAICYCARYLTDGFIPSAMIPRLINFDGIYTVSNGVTNAVSHEQITDELTRVGLFEPVENGFIVHDYLDYNPPGERVRAEKEANRRRQADWRASKGKKKGSNGVSNGVSNAVTNGLVTPAPSPSPSINKKGADAPLLGEQQQKQNGVHDPVWDLLHGEIPEAPAEPPPPETAWMPEDILDMGKAFLDATKLPPPVDKSTRGYWIKELRDMRLIDGLTQDDIRRAVRSMRNSGGRIKSPASVRTAALDIRAANTPTYTEVY